MSKNIYRSLIIALLFAVLIWFPGTIFAFSEDTDQNGQSFTDVPPDAWYYEYVEAIYAAGITTGWGGTDQYKPDELVTRTQGAAFIARTLELTYTGTGPSFTDVPPDAWFYEYVEMIYAAGITTGWGGTDEFKPDYDVTRAQMAAFIARALELTYEGTGPSFTDVSPDAWYYEYVEMIYAAGITTGWGGTDQYKPDELVTRAQMAAFIYRMFPFLDNNVVGVEPVTLTVDYGTEIADIPFPATVEAELEDGSVIDIDVDWSEESVPIYEPEVPGEYAFFGELINLPAGVTNTDNIKAQANVTIEEEPIVPAVTEVDLLWSSDEEPDWQAVSGNLSDGYELMLDPAVDFYYLDAADVESNITLADGDYGFYVDPAEQDLDYWAGRGVDADADPADWEYWMYRIITGEDPIFYLQVSVDGTDFMLVDGLQKAIGAGDQFLRINGDYPLGTYSYTGKVTGVNGLESEDIVAEITFILDEEAVESAALAEVVAGTTLSGDLEVGITATFPDVIPAFFDTAGYKINSEIVIADDVDAVVTIARDGPFPDLVFPDGLAAGTYTYTQLYQMAIGGDEPPAADFNDATYGGAVEFYEITVSGNVEAINTTVTVRSIISKDDFVTRTVLAELIDLALVVEPDPPANTLQAEVESALGYEYDPPYVYGDVEFDETTNTYTGTYTEAEFAAEQPMNDLARYLGALYRQDISTIVEIEYDGTVYTWNEAGELKGSNWEDADETTLVSVMVADYLAAPGPLTVTVSDGWHNLDVTFVLVLVENTLQAEVESALGYEYDPPYVYGDVEFSTDPNTFTGTYTQADFDAGQPMNDLARYLGALYRQDGSTIVSIEYDGTVYTWNEAEPLVGSNWEDAAGVTLVSVMVDDYLSAPGPLTVTVSDGWHNLDVTFVLVLVENTLQAELESAPDYGYDPPYEYGDFVFSTDPNTFTGTYTAAEFEAGRPMNDMARYLGALYRQAGSTIVSIEYDGTVYTWNEAEPLVGSNWEDAAGVTLVSVMVDDYLSAPGPLTVTVSDGVHFLDLTFVLVLIENT